MARGGAPDDFIEVELVNDVPSPRGDAPEETRDLRSEVGVLRAWYYQLRRPDRVALILGTYLVAIAAVLGLIAASSHPRTRTTTNTVTDPPPRSAVDALNCPADATCGVRAPGALALRAQADIGPSYTAVAYETYDRSTGVVYRRSIVATSTAEKTVVRVIAQCVPNGLAPAAPPAARRTTTVDNVNYTVERAVEFSLSDDCTIQAWYSIQTTSPASVVETVDLFTLISDPMILVLRR